jgi:phosphate transport system substrate-binding protein
MKQTIIFSILAILFLCGISPVFAKGNQLTCSGSTTVLPIAQAAAEDYMNAHPDLNISVRGGGSGVGIAALISGTVEIANSSRLMKAKEISQAKSKGINPVAYAVANDGITIIINKKNTVKELSLKQLKDIYTGKVQNWNQVGGPNMPIVIISRDVSSGTFEVFNEKVLAGAKVASSAQMLASNNAISSAVSSTPGAIGYVGLGYVTNEVKAVSVEHVMASEKTVKDKTYKLSRQLYMYTNGRAKGDAAAFLAFIQSPAGQQIVKNSGFITLK